MARPKKPAIILVARKQVRLTRNLKRKLRAIALEIDLAVAVSKLDRLVLQIQEGRI